MKILFSLLKYLVETNETRTRIKMENEKNKFELCYAEQFRTSLSFLLDRVR